MQCARKLPELAEIAQTNGHYGEQIHPNEGVEQQAEIESATTEVRGATVGEHMDCTKWTRRCF